MTTKVTMPQMGESIFECALTKWLKKVGDRVSVDEPLFEISTDKVDSEIPSPASGILSRILVPEGKTVQINTVLAEIDSGAEESKPSFPAPMEDAVPETAASEIGKKPAPTFEEKAKPEFAKPSYAPEADPKIRIQDIRTSPLVRKLARENNIDLAEMRGTGLEGRITKEDVLNRISKASPGAHSPSPAAISLESEPDAPREKSLQAGSASVAGPETTGFIGEAESVPMTPMRKAIADHMVFSKRTSAHVNTVFEVDMSPIVRLREAQKAEFQKREGLPLTITPFFAKALVDNVREFPIFNSSVSGETVVYKKPIHLGIAVALETGLIVPVVKDAHLKSFTGLALAIHDLSTRARTKRLKPEDVQNGTISLTNPGSYGALFATPIISQPQVAILGIGGIAKRAAIVGDAIAIRSMVYLSLTFDHRVIDGAVADQFMASLKKRLQSWNQWID